MPELPEVEAARNVIERSALGRCVDAVDDTDRHVCRPHPAGQIADALLGTKLIAAHRRGKTLWCDTDNGSVLGIHLGMSGKIVIAAFDGREVDGGDNWEFGRVLGDYRHSRFSLTFVDGGMLRFIDPRRLGRIRLNPPLHGLGPDAALITADQFSAGLGAGRTAIKARLLDQRVVAGVGNLLADEILLRAELHPGRSVRSLTQTERTRLYLTMRDTIDEAVRDGGVHTLALVPHRRPGGRCPYDGTELIRTTVGGRTTFWCPTHQVSL